MKRKFLASILTIAMLATMLSAINVMAEDIVGETYFDINMDDWSNYNTNKNTAKETNNKIVETYTVI